MYWFVVQLRCTISVVDSFMQMVNVLKISLDDLNV